METFPSNSIDLIIADPPYNIGIADWDKICNYYDWLISIVKVCERTLKENGTFWLFHISFPSLVTIYTRIETETLLHFKQLIIINKGLESIAGRTSLKNQRSFPRITEYLLLYTFGDYTESNMRSGKNIKVNPMAQYLRSEFERSGVTNREIAQLFPSKTGGLTGCVSNWLIGHHFPLKSQYEKMRNYLGSEYLTRKYEDLTNQYNESRYTWNLERGLTDIWKIDFYKSKNSHPTAKPPEIMRRIINTTTQVGDIVLTPFAGSGVTCLVAQELGRKWIGIDIEPEYVRSSMHRLATLDGKLTDFVV